MLGVTWQTFIDRQANHAPYILFILMKNVLTIIGRIKKDASS